MGRNIFARRTDIRAVSAALVAVVLVALIGGCGGGTGGTGPPAGVGTTGSGNVKTESRDVQGFDSVEFSGAGTLTIEQTGTESLEIQADADILPSLTSDVVGNTLQLGVKPGAEISTRGPIVYRLTVQELKGMVVSGAGEVTATALDGTELSVTHSGAGRMTASGRVTSQVVDLSGVGEYDGSNLVSEDADVSVSGTGEVVVNASGTLNARVAGVGTVEYLGDPQVTQEVTGIGKVTKR